ncbi:TolC family protein [Granulicella sp. 5B5]|uniref:TolC family protein n=1 Tax=Granulicella sp. 5B5 TaxID=1617967 RepID=UPI0015F36079|nr:TolC family protein [Granulicella sp. 5B5]QMV18470.1 TolC family protein [Granulicella sp. 5B5]
MRTAHTLSVELALTALLTAVACAQSAPKPAAAPEVPGLAGQVAPPNAPAPQLRHAEDTNSLPLREAVSGLTPAFLHFAGPYHAATVPQLFPGDATRLKGLVRDGKLYLSLEDAIDLALENNLDVETARYNLVLAQTDTVRAAGGGNVRGLDYSVQLPPNGVGGPGSPLLTADTTNTNPTAPAVTDLTSLNSTTQQTQSLSESSTGFAYSTGPNVPLFDPQIIADAGYLRRSDAVLLGGSTSGGVNVSFPQALDFTTFNASYLQGFSTGAQLEAIVNNAAQVSYANGSQLNPFHSPSTSVTLTQPLLRGFGRGVNLRYLRIASTDKKISRLVFEQQVMDTIYGTSRLYFDLVSLGENVRVKQESLRAATKLREDDENQEQQGTLAPIELTRARALESAGRFDLIQAQGLYRQQEIILRNQLLREASPVFEAELGSFTEIVPTDSITVPQALDTLDVPSLVQQALARRPDLAQAQLQVETGKINAEASRNNARPQLNLYGNVETRGSAEQPFETLGSAGTGIPVTPQELGFGGAKVSTVYQAGLQLNLPVRNRVAESDAARDAVQLRQVQARTEKLAANVRQDVETAVVALQTAQAAYTAAEESLNFQSQLLDAERDKLTVGQSTEEAVLQNEAYVAQAKSTEIAARSNWIKARIQLDYALGDLLEKNHVELDDAIKGTLP